MTKKTKGGLVSDTKTERPVTVATAELSSLNIVCGANDIQLEGLSGLTIFQVRQRIRDILNVGEDHTVVLLDGRTVQDQNTIILPVNRALEFVKPSGQKG